MKRRLVLIFLPISFGLFVRLSLASNWLPNPTLFLRGDLGTLALLLGLILTIVVGIGVWQQVRSAQRRDEAVVSTKKQATADRRRFLQRLDHELKNPLTAMQAGMANLTGMGEANEQVLRSVKAQTSRLGRLVADLRKISELEGQPIDYTSVNLDQVLEMAVDLTRAQLEDPDRSVTLSLPQAPWPLPPVSGDEDLLFLAIHNLLINALKFSESSDTIEIRAFEDGSVVVIEVADTGPGIPEDEEPYVWQELYRGKAARSVPGSGLGLALVRAITERHGGSVDLRSRIGQGTVVSMRLPAGEVTES
jgi:two-component system OmpR family sensor kinase